MTSNRPSSAMPRTGYCAALAPRPSSALPRARLQRPISAMGRPIASDLQDGLAYRPPQKDIIRPSSALGLGKNGLPDFKPPPIQCPTSFNRKGYADWEAGARGNKDEDAAEVLDKLSKAPLKERKRPGHMARHVEALKPRLAEINEVLSTLPEGDRTRALILETRADMYRAMEECLPLALVPPADYEEEQAAKIAEWEAKVGGLKEPKVEPKVVYRVDEGGVVDPVTGRLDANMLTQFKQAEALAHQVRCLVWIVYCKIALVDVSIGSNGYQFNW